MTRTEALQEARTRWGMKTHYLGETGPFVVEIASLDPQDRFRVGNGKHPHLWGWGNSWEAAFADADKRLASKLKGGA